MFINNKIGNNEFIELIEKLVKTLTHQEKGLISEWFELKKKNLACEKRWIL